MTDPNTMNIQQVPIDAVRPNAWNPNAMSEAGFERLKEEISTVGFLDPVQVVAMEDGTYMLLGGEHRWKAAKALGYETLPAVILEGEKWQDVDLQKMVTVRLNVLKGKLDPSRMAQLYDEMAEKYGEEALQKLFAYTDTSAWNQTLSAIKRGLKQAGVPQKQIEQFEKETKDVKNVENLGLILNELLASHGDTLSQNFMVFTYGKRDHVYYAMDDSTNKAVKKIITYLKESGEDINALLGPAIQAVADDVKKKQRTARKARAAEPVTSDDVEF